MSGRIEQRLLESKALAGNYFNDPTTRPLTVYLPPGYDSESDRRYPTLYLLASHGNTGQAYLNWKPWSENMFERLNRLMSNANPAVVVMPDCWTRVGSSQYLNSVMGSYEDYLIREIVPFIDATYRTTESRGVLGHSSGGYGAIVQAMRHPEIFSATACHAGDIYWEYTCLPGIAKLHQSLEKYGTAQEFMNTINDINPKGGAFWDAVMVMCWAMVFGTNPDSPLGFDLPIDPESGALNEDVWKRWLQFDPLRMLNEPDYQSALRGMKLVYITAGLYDEYQLQIGARLFCKKLAELGIAFVHEEQPIGHSGSDVPYDRSITLLTEALSPEN